MGIIFYEQGDNNFTKDKFLPLNLLWMVDTKTQQSLRSPRIFMRSFQRRPISKILLETTLICGSKTITTEPVEQKSQRLGLA